MKQNNLFGEDFEIKDTGDYTTAINLPVYEPRGKKPHILVGGIFKFWNLYEKFLYSNVPTGLH